MAVSSIGLSSPNERADERKSALAQAYGMDRGQSMAVKPPMRRPGRAFWPERSSQRLPLIIPIVRDEVCRHR